jgi:hypothetical protein
MPRIKNTSTTNQYYTVTNTAGLTVNLGPGDEADVYVYPPEGSSLEVVTDAPVWTRLVSRTEVDLDTPGDHAPDPAIPGFSGAVVEIDPETVRALLMKISGSVTAYRQTPDADPELADWTDEYPVIGIDAAGTMTKLYLSGTGTVDVFQFRRGL